MIIRAKFTKQDDIKYISHLDLMRLFQRAFRRAGVPVKYSEGFNPHPQFSLATALALGVSSDGEYMDVELDSQYTPEEFKINMNRVLPEGIKILKAVQLDNVKSLVALIRWSTYIIEFEPKNQISTQQIANEIDKFLDNKEIILEKEKRKGKKVVIKQNNVRNGIKELFVLSDKEEKIILKTTLMTGSQGNLKPQDLIKLLEKYCELEVKEDSIKINRLELFIDKDGEIVSPI